MKIRMLAAALGCCALMASGSASATTINFDNVSDGTAIDTTYSALGVTFDNPLGNISIYARSSSSAATSPNVVSVLQTGFPAFDARSGAVEAIFSTPQAQVSIDAAIFRLPEGLGTPTNSPKMEVYNTLGALIATIGWDFGIIPQPGVGAITAFETLAYSSATDSIGKVRILSGQPGGSPSNFGLFDNLSFSTAQAPIPEPTSLALLGVGFAGLSIVRRRFARLGRWKTLPAA